MNLRSRAAWQASVTGCLVACALVVVSRLIHPRNLLDLEVYRKGAWAFVHGRNPFGTGLPGPSLPYTYTPFSTVVFAPLALISLGLATLVHTFVSLVALYVSVRLVLSKLDGVKVRPPSMLLASTVVTFVIFFSEPVLQTMYFGQINLVLMAMVLIDLLAFRSRKYSGVLLGIAAGIKLTPLVFVAYLVAVRRYRAAATAAISAAGTVGLGWVLMPGPSRTYFFDLMWDARRVGNVGYVGNQSLNGLWTRALHGSGAAHHLWVASAAAVLIVGIWAAKSVQDRLGEPAGIAVCAITGLLVSPISWSHHWVWWIVPALVLADLAWKRRSGWIAGLAILWTTTFFVAPFWFVPHKNHRSYPHGLVQQLQASTYVGVGLLALLLTAIYIVRTRSRSDGVSESVDQSPSVRSRA